MKLAERRICHPGADRRCLRFVELPLGGIVKADLHACSVYEPAAAYVRNGGGAYQVDEHLPFVVRVCLKKVFLRIDLGVHGEFRCPIRRAGRRRVVRLCSSRSCAMDSEAYRPRATDVWARSPRKANWDRRPASIDKPTGSVRSQRVGLCERQSGVESEQESCIARPPGQVVRVR